MPPRVMFRGKDRPGAMWEFGSCKACNNGTGGADVVAAVISRLHPDHDEGSWQDKEIRLIRPLDKFAPGVREDKPEFLGVPASAMVRPGGLLNLVPAPPALPARA